MEARAIVELRCNRAMGFGKAWEGSGRGGGGIGRYTVEAARVEKSVLVLFFRRFCRTNFMRPLHYEESSDQHVLQEITVVASSPLMFFSFFCWVLSDFSVAPSGTTATGLRD